MEKERLHDQHVGRVRGFEEGGDRNGGSGLDSSAESLGTEGVCRNGHGGIDEVEDCRNLLGIAGSILRMEIVSESEDWEVGNRT